LAMMIDKSAIMVHTSSLLFDDPATSEIYTLSLHDALPISVHPAVRKGRHLPQERHRQLGPGGPDRAGQRAGDRQPRLALRRAGRSEEHTSELQSRENLVCRLLLEKKKKG